MYVSTVLQKCNIVISFFVLAVNQNSGLTTLVQVCVAEGPRSFNQAPRLMIVDINAQCLRRPSVSLQ